jgi:hypothetical protein
MSYFGGGSTKDCPYCKKVIIKESMEACASCANGRYLSNIASGAIVEVRVDMSKVKQSTLQEIRRLIAEDERLSSEE